MQKRRQIVPQQNKITNSFASIKPRGNMDFNINPVYSTISKNNSDLKDQGRGLNLNFNKGGQNESGTPFRSTNRLNNMLKSSTNCRIANGSGKAVEAGQDILASFSKKELDESRPSSVATAVTCATTVYDYPQKRTGGSFVSEKKKSVRTKKDSKSFLKKRSAQKSLANVEMMEMYSRLPKDRIKKLAQITLRQKKTGLEKTFQLHKDEDIYKLKNDNVLREFEKNHKLEVEFDYDTDEEQVKQSKQMLLDDLMQAIDFFVKEDPLKLVSNLLVKSAADKWVLSAFSQTEIRNPWIE